MSNQPRSSPRLQPPELLSGVPERPVVEISPERPWLTINETNRLIRQQGLALAVAQAWVLDEIVSTIEITPERENLLIRRHLESQSVDSDEALAEWLQQRRLSFDDLRYFATKGFRLRCWLLRRYRDEAELRFLERKLDLDQVVYSLLQLPTQELAEELYQRLREGEADFAYLAQQHSLGPERRTRAQVGPVGLTAGPAAFVSRLRISRQGQLWPPFQLEEHWCVLRFEQLIPAQLNARTRGRMIEELFQVWFRERVKLLMDGEPLPPLPYLPPSDDTEDLADEQLATLEETV
jgi:parvulin-like peptidyl-prolyl isomerase